MSVVTRLPVVSYQQEEEPGDVFAAEETKLHTLSRATIAEMLDTAERQEKVSSTPPPPSGIRVTGALSIVAPHDPLPRVWEDDEGLEPTQLSERIVVASVPRPYPSPPPPSVAAMKVLVAPPRAVLPFPPLAPPSREVELRSDGRRSAKEVNRRALAVACLAFCCTLVPALWALLHH